MNISYICNELKVVILINKAKCSFNDKNIIIMVVLCILRYKNKI
jgi:hypothetical protein